MLGLVAICKTEREDKIYFFPCQDKGLVVNILNKWGYNKPNERKLYWAEFVDVEQANKEVK